MSRSPYDLHHLLLALCALSALTGAFGHPTLSTLFSTASALVGFLLLWWLRELDRLGDEGARQLTLPPSAIQLTDGMKKIFLVLQGLADRLRSERQGNERLRQAVRQKEGSLKRVVDRARAISGSRLEIVENQLHAVKRVSGAWDQINSMSERIAAQAEEVERASSQASSSSEAGSKASNEAVDRMGQVREAVMAIADRMRVLRSTSDKVEDTARAIDQVSTQINLLALNAAIEAAGAGEYGERFGVVAVEVKQLADQTVVATRMIKELLEDIRSEVQAGIELTQAGALAVQSGFENVQQLESILGGLSGAIHLADRNAKTILSSTKVQVFAVRNARKEVEGIEETLITQGEPDRELREATEVLEDLAADLSELEAG